MSYNPSTAELPPTPEFNTSTGTNREFTIAPKEAELLDRFKFHPATDITKPRHESIRSEFSMLASFVFFNVPDSPERIVALERLQESMMWCNAAVAIHS